MLICGLISPNQGSTVTLIYVCSSAGCIDSSLNDTKSQYIDSKVNDRSSSPVYISDGIGE